MTATGVPAPQLENPFLGLRSFTSEESYLYFGREGQSDELLRKMDRSHFVAILGVSGSGKSSLVRAGLLPSLYSGYLASAGADWRIADFRPGGDPIGNLAAALTSTGFWEKGLDADQLRSSSLAIVAAAKAARDSGEWPERENLLILADQFEELFRFRAREESAMADRDEKAAFVKLLLEAGRQQDLPIYVVITMRSDFLGDCSQFRDLPEAINNGQYLIPQMTREQRRAAIESPVKVAGGAISPRLVQRILNEIGEDPGQLPIMQHALMRTFDHWCEHGQPGGTIDIGDYEAIGTLTDALSTHADEAFAETGGAVPGRGEEIAKRLFQRLRDQDANGREIRRPSPLGELAAVAEAPVDETLAVLECFRQDKRSFIMPPPGVRLRSDSQVDITHECLLRRWKRLTGWVAEELEARRIFVRLADRAEEYEHTPGSDFLGGAQLQVAVEWWERWQPGRTWAERYHPGLESAGKFLRASQEYSERERIQQEEARQAEERRGIEELRRNQQAREEGLRIQAEMRQKEIRQRSAVRLMRAATVAAVVGVALAAWALIQTRRAQNAKEIAQVQLFASQANDTRAAAENLSVWLGLEAVSLRDPKLPVVPQAEQALHRAILVDAREVMLFPPPADPPDRPPTLPPTPPPPLRSVAFSGDGMELLTGGDDGKATVWDLSTGQPVHTTMPEMGNTDGPWRTAAAFMADKPSSLTFCCQWQPGGSTAAHAPRRVFVAARGREGWRAFALSPDGRRFATGGPNNQIAVWDANTGAIVKTLDRHKGPVKALAFSSDGSLLASSSGDGNKSLPPFPSKENPIKENRVTIWNVADGTVVREIEQQPDQVLALAFSPDGRLLAGGREDWVAIVWSVSTGREIRALLGHSDDVAGVAFSADGARLATASLDNTVRIWDAATFEPVNQIVGHTKPVTGVVFHPDGTRLATSSEDGTARIWDLVSEQELVSTPGHRVQDRSVSFTPDGSRLVTGDNEGTLTVWSIADRWERAVMKHGAALFGAVVSPDGTTAASAGAETVKIWDLANGALRMEFPRPPWKHAFDKVDFSPDGQVVATGGQQGPQVYSLKTRERLTPAWQDTNQIRCVAFAPGAERILAAGGGLDGKIRIFKADTGELLDITKDSLGTVYSIVFSPDGRYMATGHQDGKVVVWLWDKKKHSASRLRTMEGHSGWVLAAAFSSDSTRLATGAVDKIIKLWDPEAGTELFSIRAHTDRVYSVAFSPNRMWLASAGSDGYIRLHPDGIPQLLATARARLYKSPTMPQCISYIKEVGGEWPCELKVAAAKAVSEANRQARVYDIDGAKKSYSQAPNPRLQVSPADEANSAARASMISEARKLARTGHIDSAMDLLARFGATFGANVGREDVNRLYELQLAADGRIRSRSADSSQPNDFQTCAGLYH